MLKVIDLFAGCGGLSLGFIQNDFEIKKAVEFDKTIAETYKNNHPHVEIIVDDIKNVDLTGVFCENDADVIIGGPPCQGFSMAGARNRNGFIDDPRNYLFKHYFNVVKTVKPKMFIMENVKGIKTMQDGKIFEEIVNLFSNAELLDNKPYYIYYKLVKAIDFGIPQKRERMIIIGSQTKIENFETMWEETKKSILLQYPHFFDKVTVKDAISNLPSTTIDGKIENPIPENQYQIYLSTNNINLYNHVSTKHSNVAINRMKQISSGENFMVLEEKINSIHSGSYGRLSWESQAPTITTRFDTPAGGRYTHPTEDRTLSPREAARIQSFPDNFIFYGSKSSICKQIGNAVPPKISYFLSEFTKKVINK